MGDVNQRLFLTRAIGASRPRAVLEVGSRDYGNTTSFRDVFGDVEYVGVDLSAGKNVDRVIDLAAGIGDLAEGHFGLVICCSVLEHVRRPWVMAENLTRLMSAGGMIYVAVPWVWRYHPYPDDYFRFSWRGIAELFPQLRWEKNAFSTNVAGEFHEITGNGFGLDDGLAKHIATPAGARKYLPYLQVHMLGVKS